MAKGETDYEIWGLKPLEGTETMHPLDVANSLKLARRTWVKITSCDTQAAVMKKLAKLK
jgi:hypothetical protein